MKRMIVFSAAILAAFSFQAQAQVIIGELPGLDGGAGFAGATDYRTGDTVTAPAEVVAETLDQIGSGDLEPTETESIQIPIFDLTDPGTNGAGGAAIPGTPIEYPLGGGDDFITVVKGAVNVTDPGPYTIQVLSDDGAAFQFPGLEFSDHGGGGEIDPDDPSTIVFRGNTGNTNMRGVIDLPEGVHRFQAFNWERGGGAYFEVSSAKGEFPNGGASFLGLGSSEKTEDRTIGAIAKLTGAAYLGVNYDAFDQDLELERESHIEIGMDHDDQDTIDVLVIDDDRGDETNCPFGANPSFRRELGDDVPRWPGDAGEFDVNDFSAIILGTFVLDDGDETPGETMTVSVHVDSDDRGSFRVIGQDFDEVTGDEILELDGDDSIFANRNTCNTNVTGVIQLTEGVEYDFESVLVERGGDAGIQVLFSAGNVLDGDPADYFALAVDGVFEEIMIPGNTGLPFGDPSGDPCDFDGSGVLDVGDIDLLAAGIRAGDNSFDVNGDGVATDADLNFFITDESKLHTWIGDANLDGEFNSSDFVDVFQAGEYEDATDGNSTWSTGDWNGDGDFNSSDFVAAFQDGGFELGPRWAPEGVASVPEPSSLALLLLGALGLFGARRRQ